MKLAGKCLFHDTQIFFRSQWIVDIPQCCCGVAVTEASTNLIKGKTGCVQAACVSLSQFMTALRVSTDVFAGILQHTVN